MVAVYIFITDIIAGHIGGIRSGLSDKVSDFLGTLRSVTDLPLALGFELSTAEQVKLVKDKCDGIIMGSKILDIILGADDIDKRFKELEKFFGEIIKVL